MSELSRYNRYIDGLLNTASLTHYDFSNKDNNIDTHVLYMLNRTQAMFEWKNLPDTIPNYMLELYLQMNGYACFAKYEDTLYVFWGGLGGVLDEYYRPTTIVISNPYLRYNATLNINEDCIVMPNDTNYMGLAPLFSRYGALITENELSMYVAVILTRLQKTIAADNSRTKESADEYINDIIKGKLAAIADSPFFEGVKMLDASINNSYLNQLIEIEQYLKASEFNEIGINANYNMKREQLNMIESQMDNDALLPLVDNMLTCRKEWSEKVNDMFGTSIEVEFNSSWKFNESRMIVQSPDSINTDLALSHDSGQTENEIDTEEMEDYDKQTDTE